MKFTHRCLFAAAFLFALGVALPTWAQNNSFPTTGPVLICSGSPWIDIKCNGADPTDSADSTAAIQTTINTAVTNNWPVLFSQGTYRITSQVTIDYATQHANGFQLISQGATLDARAGGMGTGPVLQVQCGGGTPASPVTCFYFHQQGTLNVLSSVSGYSVVIGKPDFSDQLNSVKIDHLLTNNASTGATAGGCQFNSIYDSDIFAVCDAAGGASGIALEQTQFSRISGAGTASGTGGRSLTIENGYNFSDTFYALDLEVSPTCLSVTTVHNGVNTFISPYFNCNTAVATTNSNATVLVNPNYGGNTVNYGPSSTGVSVIGTGSRPSWIFPSASSYTAAVIDDGISVSSYNATSNSLSVTLPSMATVNPGWSMGLATDNGKGLQVCTPDATKIISGGKNSTCMTMASSLYEYARLQADGNSWRLMTSTRDTRLLMGYEPPPWPSKWLYPSSGYSAVLSDNGEVLSSFNAGGGNLTVTLPANSTPLPNGWSMGFATDSNNTLTIKTTPGGGNIVFPGSGGSTQSITMPKTTQGSYEFLVLQYDSAGSSGNFRVLTATPATQAAIGMLGTAGITHWSFPTVSAYTATTADNGNAISSYNSPLSFLTVTLPQIGTISPGWSMAVGSDNSRTAAFQVNGLNGEKILIPGLGGLSQTSITTASGQNYEFVEVQFDGSNFRVVSITPQTANSYGGLIPTAQPADSSTCKIGQMAQGNQYLYVCVQTNVWNRVLLSSY